MSDYTLTIPEAVYKRLRQVAEATDQGVDQVAIEPLKTISTPLSALPPEEEAELEALKSLLDDALWTIAEERMAEPLQTRTQGLMDKNSSGEIQPDEYAELEKLVEKGQRLMVRKSEAAAILTERGYRVKLWPSH